ncbi:MAG: hypothetical protein QNJ36_16880 [Calothrix sp. MO_167.B42]|nr:hypothetical protein [Calothrix sp. MO_167.B42]
MPQPIHSDLFGAGASINQATGNLEIPLIALATAGLNTENPSATGTLGAIIKNAHSWLSANVDEEVMVTSSLEEIAPIDRNGQERTEFGYTINFYADYEAPIFDPDEV